MHRNPAQAVVSARSLDLKPSWHARVKLRTGAAAEMSVVVTADDEREARFKAAGLFGMMRYGSIDPASIDLRPVEAETPPTPSSSPLGFTLVELLVVITIIGLISAATLPLVLSSIRERAIVAAASQLQAAIAGARDRATLTGRPAGIRLIPDPTLLTRLPSGQVDPSKILAASRWVPIAAPPDYSEGLVSIYPGATYTPAITGGRPCLVLEQAPGEWHQSAGVWAYLPNPPTTWWGNIRLGDQVVILGRTLTVCGPMVDQTADLMTNIGPPGTPSPLTRTYTAPDGTTTAQATPEYLLLTNGLDDDQDAFADNGWDGLDQDLNGLIDDLPEWELETWPQPLARGLESSPYVIHRRPAPIASTDSQALPAGAVIDLTTWSTTRERSRLPVDPLTGSADLLIDPLGRPSWSLPYGVPSSIGLGSSWVHLWLANRGDLRDPDPASPYATKLPLPGQLGELRILTLSPAGRVSITTPSAEDLGNPSAPFHAPQQGD